MQRYGRFNRPGLRGSANYALLGGTEGAAPSPPPGPPSPSWTLDFSTGEPWANGTNYTFSSTASTSRTFVNSSGYVAPCVANLVVQSQTFDTSWALSQLRAFGSGSTANAATAPDNTTTADLITENNVTGDHGIGWIWASGPSTANQRICCSVFAKKPTSNAREVIGVCGIQDGIGYFGKRFNLTTGAAVGADYNTNTSTFTNLQSGIEDYGNGWYRCWCSVQTSSTAQCGPRIALMVNSTTPFSFGYGSYTGDNASGLLIWGAQMEYGVTQPSSYSRTTTSSNGIPRLMHNSSGSRLGLLVEEQRANLLLRSEEFDNAYWTKSGLLAFGSGSTANAATAPDNTTTADLITESSGGTSGHYCVRTFGTFTANNSYTWSIFVKKPSSNARDFATLTLNGASGHNLVRSFDLGDGTSTQNSLTGANFSSAAGGSEDYGNGWWRLWIRVTIGGTAVTSCSVIVATSTSKTPTLALGAYPNQTGDGVSGILVWGAQLEANATISSYIPTTTASVTRSADIASVATSNITGFANNSTLLVEYYRPATNGMVTATNEATVIMGNTGFIGVRSVNTATQSDVAWGMGWTQSGANGTLTGTVNATLQKFAYTINSGGTLLKSCMNGSMLTTSKTGDDPNMTLPDKLFLGQEEGGTLYSNVIIRKVAFYDSVLSDADMQTITT